MWPLSFISEDDFLKHVEATIQQYGEKLEQFDLKKFNKNIIDPIKLIFDKTVYKFSWEEIVRNEIFRQRDKSNNNDIGYFHQRIFQYINDCTVPVSGWDVVFEKESGITLPDGDKVSRIFVEMKNKHNTMNSAASGRTYIRMQSQLLSDDDCACFLVEVIAKQSQNATWVVSVDGQKQKHRRIRRMSIDQFYALVTKQEDAFYQMCMILPSVIEKAVVSSSASVVPEDSVIDELNDIAKSKDGPFALALYLLGFGSYFGFKKNSNYDEHQGDNFSVVSEQFSSIVCKKCKQDYQWRNWGDVYEGGKTSEDITCPYCGNVDGSIITSGRILSQKS
jgi:hypothetical protein